MTIAEIMSREPVTVPMDATLASIDELFRARRFHHVLVTEGRRLRGVISDRDVLGHVSPFVKTPGEQARDVATLQLRAHQVMTRKLVTASPSDDVRVAAETLIGRNISCLPVVDAREQLVGVVTWRDVLRALVLPREVHPSTR